METSRRVKLRPRPRLSGADDLLDDDVNETEEGGRISYTAVLLTQGTHRFYTLSMPSDILAETCMVERRNEEPAVGFQRALDRRRAEDIARYIDNGFGTIPGSIVLSAQPEAELEYRRSTRTLSFNRMARAFLILDGQHRVYGFQLASSRLRVPAVIYNGLSRVEECRLFMDINTKQRPVPNELLLDIKRLADTESDSEALFRDVFDSFEADTASPLLGLMTASEKKRGRISRVTFNNALKAIDTTFEGSDAQEVYNVLSAYIEAIKSGLRQHGLENSITNPTLFRALMYLFPSIAERVADRHPEFSVANFDEIVGPFFARLKKADLQKPGSSPHTLHETFRKTLRSGFTIGRGVPA